MLHRLWDLPRPGIEPGSPALAGGLLTGGPPRKPSCVFFFKTFQSLRGGGELSGFASLLSVDEFIRSAAQ